MKNQASSEQEIIEIMNNKMRKIADLVSKELPKDLGFTVLAFPFNEKGRLFYVSNADRLDIVEAMKEWIEKTGNNNFGKDI